MWDSGGNMVFGGALMWIVWLLLLVLIAAIIRALLGGHNDPDSRRPPADSALDVLRKRYARGEIDEQEFNRRRQELDK